jgi:hypothetical protein
VINDTRSREACSIDGPQVNACSLDNYTPGLRGTDPETEYAASRFIPPHPCSSLVDVHAYRTMPSNRFLYHLTVSAWLTRWEAPILLLHRLRLATRSPGRVMQT